MHRLFSEVDSRYLTILQEFKEYHTSEQRKFIRNPAKEEEIKEDIIRLQQYHMGIFDLLHMDTSDPLPDEVVSADEKKSLIEKITLRNTIMSAWANSLGFGLMSIETDDIKTDEEI
jgi:hypothetical protein